MDGGVEQNTTMRSGGGKGAPSSRWPEMLFHVVILITPLVVPVTDALAATDPAAFDARTLLTLGINLGVIAFAIGTAIACLRATERARAAARVSAAEADRYRQSESTLDTVLAAEPQALLIVAESGPPELLVANLPVGLGVPRDAETLLTFEAWLDAPSASALELALQALADRGEAFNLMLSTLRDQFIEVDGRIAGRTIMLKAEPLRLLGCGHVFHTACIDQWLLMGSGNCPFCNRCVRETSKRDKEGQAGQSSSSPSRRRAPRS